MKILRFDELDSTQTYAKGLLTGGASEDLIVTARRQTGGRGTKGRRFSSEEGGMYLTSLTFYQKLAAADAFKIMAGAAVAVAETLENFGLTPCIKWANDVFVGDRKICGILTENTLTGAFVHASLVGIGINVNNDFPAELKDIAVSMREAGKKQFDVEEVGKVLIERLTARLSDEGLSGGGIMREYLKRIGYLGRSATLIFGDRQIPARLISVDERGGLNVLADGKEMRLTYGEVSLKLR